MKPEQVQKIAMRSELGLRESEKERDSFLCGFVFWAWRSGFHLLAMCPNSDPKFLAAKLALGILQEYRDKA